MRNLIVIGHPNQESFCYNGIFKTIKNELETNGELVEVIDLYRNSFARPRTELIKKYKELVTWCDRIYFISPVWWFRLTPRTELFYDELFTLGFASNLLQLLKCMGIQPLYWVIKKLEHISHTVHLHYQYSLYI